ncbi:Flp family type IVb pilin [Tsuneonella aeria]|uniref:Flp family type IVb pilin n=1 Tax=Tsuneonella aeria TaxID=1837929 RepID=UPI001F3065BE|nr:Flp family type IVb pilin [Tsuneonella aeria]
MKNFLKTFAADESGASAAEYALIIAIVGVGIGAAAMVLGANVKEAIDGASTDINNCNNAEYAPEGGAPATSDGVECTPAAG